MNGRIDGSGRACQRPRTSNGAKCFSCEGALAREIAFLKFLAINVALPEATPSPFGTATLRLAPSALAPLGLRSAAKCAPPLAQHLFLKSQYKINREIHLLRWAERACWTKWSVVFFQASLFGGAGFKSALCLRKLIFFLSIIIALGGAGLLDEVERSGTRRVQTARAWPRAAQLPELLF